MNDKEMIRDKAIFFKEENTAVHIKKHNGWFYNGLILEVKDNLLILDDIKSGSMPLFFAEIFDIEKREIID